MAIRSGRTTYFKRLLEANEDMEEATRGISEFSHTLAVEKLLDCYFSIVLFDLEFKNSYTIDSNEVDPYQLMALHVMLIRKQFDIDNLLRMVNKNTIQANLSVLQRLFTNNRAFGEVVSILNKVTDLRLGSKSPRAGEIVGRGSGTDESSPLPTGLSRFDMSVANGFDAIIGQERAVKRVRSLVGESVTVGQPLSVILYGPPGTGKTSVALAIGREHKLNVYTISVASLGGHYIGEREKNTVGIFNYLENLEEDVLLFVDEADSFLSAAGPDDTQQKRYTRAVTVDLFDRFLKPRKQSDASADDDRNESTRTRARVLLLATNFEKRITEDIRRRSAMILIDLPRSPEDMYRLVDFYRRAYRINMTRRRLERVVRYSLRLELAPSHVSQIMRRLSTQVLLDMLKRGVIVGRYTSFGKRSRPNPMSMLALPAFTVGGTAVKEMPGLRDTVVKLFNVKQEKHKKRERLIPLTGEERAEIPASAVYPCYDGDVERFFRSYPGFDGLMAEINGEDSTRDPDFVTPDDENGGDVSEEGTDEHFGVAYDELRWAGLATSDRVAKTDK